MFNASAAQISSILRTTEKVGAKVPGDITKAYARYEKVNAALSTIYVGGNALADATLAAIDNNRDPAADPEVQRILASQSTGQEGVTGAVRQTVLGELVQAAGANADKLIAAWQKPFDTAALTVRETAQQLGPIALSDAQAILTKGGDAAEQWTKASQANHVIDDIVAAWTLLAAQTQFVPDSRNLHLLKFTDPTLEQWEEHGLNARRLSAWDAHALGLPLTLADGPEYMARARRHDQARQKRALLEQQRSTGKRLVA